MTQTQARQGQRSPDDPHLRTRLLLATIRPGIRPPKLPGELQREAARRRALLQADGRRRLDMKLAKGLESPAMQW